MNCQLLNRCWMVLACAVTALAVTGVSVAAPKKKVATFDPDKDKAVKTETELIGDYTTFQGFGPVVLTGVGLVVDLPGTGGDPEPSAYRTMLLEELKRFNVPNPNKVLASPNTALVVVRCYLPPLLKPGEKVDVEVVAPESGKSTSIAGGWLMECFLSEQTMIPGQGVMKGHVYARAKGPVLASGVASADAKTSISLMNRGRVLGGATLTRDRELAIYLRNDFRSVRNSSRIANAVGTRFHDYDKYGTKKPMAVAKTDAKITLELQPKYKDNYPRYLQVIRHMAFKESVVAQRIRMERLQEELFESETSDKAALQLEAIGTSAIPLLKAALKAPTLECQFNAATALAYLGDASGVETLARAAREEAAFRVFALAAMSTIDDADAHMALRELMSENSAELRYGAFRALWTLDRNDPFIRGIPMVEPLDPALPEEVAAEQERQVHFILHVLETKGDPMVHVTMRARPEVVVFGADQKFATPLLLEAGRYVMITAQPGSETASVVRFSPDRPDERREVSLKVADIIRAAVDLGARYPDVVQMLSEASRQRNLPTRLASDALPEAGRVYVRPGEEGETGTKAKIGRDHMAPNMFPVDPVKQELEREERDWSEDTGVQASVAPEEGKSPETPSQTDSEPTAKTKSEKAPFAGNKEPDDSGSEKPDPRDVVPTRSEKQTASGKTSSGDQPFGLINRLRARR